MRRPRVMGDSYLAFTALPDRGHRICGTPIEYRTLSLRHNVSPSQSRTMFRRPKSTKVASHGGKQTIRSATLFEFAILSLLIGNEAAAASFSWSGQV
jgi:hypothetical protein